jgi:hypothetical protein
MRIFSILLILAIVGCMPRKQEQRDPDAGRMTVREYVSIDTTNQNNQIVLAKFCTETPNFKYMYQLKNGTWLASNERFCIGDFVQLDNYIVEPKKEEKSESKKSNSTAPKTGKRTS